MSAFVKGGVVFGNMAANVTKLPPRGSRKLDEKTIMRNRSSLDTLLQMGFPRNRM